MTRAPRSTQKAAQRADQAADQLLDWLRQQRGGIFVKAPDAAGPEAMLVAGPATIGETVPSPGESIFHDEDYTKAERMEPVFVAAKASMRQDFGEASQGIPSLRSSTSAIEPGEALAHAGGGPVRGPSSFGNATSGVEETTSPVRVQARDDERPEDFLSRLPNSVAGSPLRLPHTDWLHHRLDVRGPAAALTDFQTVASGAGTIPWQLDRDRMEEDLFHLLVAPPAPQRRHLSLAGARVLARQLCDAAELRHEAAVARVGHSWACPLDLHAVVPVPPGILALGPDHKDSLAWLWVHWGTTEVLRYVALETAFALRQPLPAGTATLRFSFWSADWTPWRALAVVAARWPALRFDVTPTYCLL